MVMPLMMQIQLQVQPVLIQVSGQYPDSLAGGITNGMCDVEESQRLVLFWQQLSEQNSLVQSMTVGPSRPA